MALYYLESSALAKLYVREPGTEHLLELARNPSENRLAILAISPVEVRSAIRRRERAGDIDTRTASLILDRLQHHVEGRFIYQMLNEQVLDGAREMIDRYALRAYDAIQLAGCLVLKTVSRTTPPAFVSSDRELIDAARSEMLSVIDPSALG